MADPLRSYRALKKWIDSTGCFNDIRLVYHGLGPLGAHMFKHFIPVSAIASAYYGDEVSRYMEAEWGTRIFSYEKMNRVRVNDCGDYYSNFFHDHGPALVAAIEARGGEACLAPFAPSNAIHEFIFTSAPSWRLLTNLKIAQDYFEFKSRLAMEAARIGIPMPPASRVMSFESLDYRRLADSYEGGFVIQTPLSQAGTGTEFVFSEDDFNRIIETKKKLMGDAFAKTPAKVTPFLSGPSPNCTGCVVNGAVALSPPDIQIVGDPYFVKRPGQYIGSDFTVGAFTPEHHALMADVVTRVGRWLGSHGYRGNFGVDFLSTVDRNNRIKDIYVSEVNARMVGESQYLADFQTMKDCVPLTFFHLAEWLGVREIGAREIAEYNQALPAIEGSALILYTQEKGIFEARGGITAGIYRIEEGKLVRIRDGYLLSQTRNSDEIVITCGVPWEGLVIGHPLYGDYNVHLCYILTRESIVDPDNYRVVSAKWRGVVDLVYRSLGLTPCEPRRLLKEMPA